MRKIPTNENAGRSSPTLTPTTPTGSTPNIIWGSGARSKPTTPASNAGDHLGSAQSTRDVANQGLTGPSGSTNTNWSSSAQDFSQYKFSREFILSLFDPSLPTPPDFEPAPAMTSDRVLEPMANIPLNENEKKLFTSQSVNSEISARRTPYGRGETKEGVVRPPRAPGTAQRGYSNRTDRVGSQSDGYRPTRRADAGDEDPWDIPAGVGSFSGNGMFGRDDEGPGRNGADGVREETLLFANRGRDSPARTGSPASLERRDISPGKLAGAVNGNHPSSTSAATSLHSAPLSRTNDDASRNNQSRTSFVDMFSTFGGSSPLNTSIGGSGNAALMKSDLGMSLGGKLGTSDPLAAPIMTRSLSKNDLVPSQLPPGIMPAPTPFVPQSWQYKDPSGIVQGPFTAAQMHEWFRSGYFSDELPIKRVDDYSYEPLARLLQKYGRDRPFLSDMEEAERLHQQLESQRRVPGIGLSNTATGFRDIYQNEVATPGGSISYNAFGTFGAGGVAQSMYAPGGATASPFDAIGRDRFGAGGFDPLSTGAYGRTSSWAAAETPGAIRTGWSALNPEVERRGSPFGRPVAAPGSPAGGLQSSYFDQRSTQADGFISGGGSSQRPSTTFTPFSAAQGSAPQSPAANLFSGQPILDFSATQAGQHGKQPEWGNISGLAGSHYHDDAHAPIDVISKLIDESHYEPEDVGGDAGISTLSEHHIEEQFSRLSVDPASNTEPVDSAATTSLLKQDSDKPVGKARKTRKEERQERFERENELRKEQQNKLALAAAAATASAPETETSASVPAVDLRQIMSEEHSRSKREKEQAALESKRRMQAEIEQTEKAGSNNAVAATSAWGASAGAGNGAPDQKLSLKQIQEIERSRAAIEESERARRAREAMLQQAQMLHEQEALAAAQSWSKDQAAGAVWGGTAAAKPQPSARQKKNLAEIMEEEERRKRKEAELRGAQLAESGLTVLPTGSGKRYADTIATVGNSSTIAWGLTAAGARPPVVNRPAAVIASGNVVKATGPGVSATAGTTGRPEENVVGTWNVVGKQGQVVRPPAPPSARPLVPAARPAAPAAPRIVSVHVAPSPPVVATEPNIKGPSSTFMQWCRTALHPLSRSNSSGVNVEDFIGILLSINPNESDITQSICDDILGGLTAIDPRKFAEEFGRRRKADANGSVVSGSGDVGWTPVGASASGAGAAGGSHGGNSLDTFDSGNKFVVVGKQTKKKKGKR
ncbi:hypothetical protein HDU87_001413 [Geranomyces variabilis]|uniref:GYF domain-containing protein n=1 Tax=Geranomyces variabilis TaxID=109894 RepID=A0AAD5XPG3_9FUNG|nr:hypothetical protein HDU87_001413 [Geranomyces variabilis]